MTQFGFDTKGTEVVAAFPDKVKNKICMFSVCVSKKLYLQFMKTLK